MKAAATSSALIACANFDDANRLVDPLLRSVQPCLAILPDFPSINQVIGYQITGLAVVFIALGSLWGMMELLGAVFRAKSAREAAAAAAARAAQPAAVTPPTPEPADSSPGQLIAVIVASVHTALGGRAHKIVAIHAPEASASWSVEGRREVFVSHRVR